ncbi:MAG: hypothetical protein HQL56_19130 [Magnetococcales bacterium]|nr:hypothetical protein [Magnetococcales bacterium]
MGKTFSENWFRVANLRLGLRTTVSVRLHRYREEPWYVLHEKINNTFHRVSPATWRFISRLQIDATIDEIWRQSIEEDPRETPGQEEIFQLLMSLHQNNLLYLEGGADERRLLERGEEKKKKPFLARLSELMFLRIPLVDPDPWLNRLQKPIRLLFGWPGALVSLVFLVWGVWELLLGGDRAWNQAQHLLQWHNVILLYLAIFVSKGLHEFGHAALCKRYGAPVRHLGFMLLMFSPLPYVDVTSSWTLRNRFQRAAIGCGGMLVDLVVASIATVVWAHSPPGAVNEIAYNLMFTTAIYTVVFNLNPLMRFDGYYILSDLIGVPNLHESCKATFQRWFRHRFLSMEEEGEGLKPGETAAKVTFFLGSNLYRLFVMGGIVLFVADSYMGVGLVVAVAMALTSFVLPLQQQLQSLKSPLFRYQQKRLLQRGGVIAGLLALLFLFAPAPDHRTLTGVSEAALSSPVYAETEGLVKRIHLYSGAWVEQGTTLLEMENPELEAEIQGVEAQLQHTRLLAAKSVDEGAVDLAPLQERLRTLNALKNSLLQRKQALQVVASQDGYWVAPEIAYRTGVWLARGAELGKLVDDRSHIFRGVVVQEAAAALLQADPEEMEVRLEGETGLTLQARELTLVPHSRETLPSAALGPAAGGHVPVTTADPSGKQSAEPYFLLQVLLTDKPGEVGSSPVRSGRSGWIRVKLPWRPLSLQLWTATRQFFQRRYRL